MYDATTLAPLRGPAAFPGPRAGMTAFSPDFTHAATIVGTARVDVYETSAWQRLSSIDVPLATQPRRQLVQVAFAGDADHVLTSTNGSVDVWRRRRPTAEWGIIALPHFWLAAALTLALVVSAARDVLRFFEPAPQTPVDVPAPE